MLMKKADSKGFKLNQNNMLILLVVVLIAAFALYVALDKIPEMQKAKEERISQKTFDDVLGFLIEETEECGVAQVFFENKTRNLVDLKCAEEVFIEGYRSAVQALFVSSEGCAAVPVTYENQTKHFIEQECMFE